MNCSIKKITSRQNNKIKHCLKLINSVKFRQAEKLFVIEGLRLCKEAVINNLYIKSTFLTQTFLDKNVKDSNTLINHSENTYVIPDSLMNAVSDAKNSQGILAICNMPESLSLSKEINRNSNFNLLGLEQIQDPANLGTILRTAAAFGLKNIVLTKSSCDIYSPKVLRASMGSLFKIRLFIVESMNSAIGILSQNGFKTYAAVVDKDAKDVRNININTGKNLIIIGNEGNGIKEETLTQCDNFITIPMDNKTESLNVAVSSGILIWEMVRNYFGRR